MVFVCLASPRLMAFYGAQSVDDVLKQFPRIDAVMKGCGVLADVAVKIHVAVLRMEVEQSAVNFEGVPLLAEPIEEPDGIVFDSIESDIAEPVAA